MTLKTGVMMLKSQLCITEINYTHILNWNILEYYCFCCIFGQINTGEQKRLASKH